MSMTFSATNFADQDCKTNEESMRENLSSDITLVLRRMGGAFPVSAVVHFFQHLFS